MHSKGEKVLFIGVDIEKLARATAFEMDPTGPEQQAQLRFNLQLVLDSNGLMAPLTGQERFLSVSCSHTTQFFRCVDANTKTPEGSLQDKDGRLNKQALCAHDPFLAEVLEKGYDWTIIPWYASKVWPNLPSLAEKALNSDNLVAASPSEMETALAIAQFAKQQGDQVNWSECELAAKAMLPACMRYMWVITDFVKFFGGGAGAPLVVYLAHFARQFSANLVIGQQFFTSVVQVQFPTQTSRYPSVRASLIAANLVSPKVVDGLRGS